MLTQAPHESSDFPIEIIHRPKVRGHGGAWKVAYADFVTALLALFIVLWLMNGTQKVKQSVSGYFRDPRGFTQTPGAGRGAQGEGLSVDRDHMQELRRKIEAAIAQAPEFTHFRENVLFSVTGEGLRIDLVEDAQGMFFVTGSPAPTQNGEALLKLLAGEVKQLPNRLIVEGHTDSRPFRNAVPEAGYGNFELAADRANEARRLLHSFGAPPGQVVEVRGFADQRLLHPETPEDPRNRRVSLVVKFIS